MTTPRKPRISYVPYEDMDEEMQAEMRRAAEHGTPRPETNAIRAHVPAAFWAFAKPWEEMFRNGVCDHAIKELCRVYISRTVTCEFCGNQRSERGQQEGLVEGQYDELLNFESSDKFDDRQKAALAYAQAIAWNEDDRDGLWDRLHAYFTEEELVELGCVIALTFGQQSWIRLLDVDHHQYMAGTSASLAPGFETPEALAETKSKPDYWAASAPR
ncbi:MAG TPA: carboxymuconolactone decarboxylase [Nocardioides sp.]|jgi:alkylhydroperoxidase family enzyme|nr:carboxymuconolactone decarboxylase [uncultured Nocardioides sp.]HEX5985318.1 carboxymuconolactone decarboxylase [Nocardioides sp.]